MLDTTPTAFGIVANGPGIVTGTGTGGVINMNAGPIQKLLSGNTTVFLVAQCNFTASTAQGWGTIRARRVH
jgi:hypothetical protein